ncbi:hypothetical protein V8G54_003290 [Vigna mungo]|uniref:Uncharacterized protein n=1 Tax=Vigna mungo TaxID=3915 RepID=A0AAQ3P9T3_VIGMU
MQATTNRCLRDITHCKIATKIIMLTLIIRLVLCIIPLCLLFIRYKLLFKPIPCYLKPHLFSFIPCICKPILIKFKTKKRASCHIRDTSEYSTIPISSSPPPFFPIQNQNLYS